MKNKEKTLPNKININKILLSLLLICIVIIAYLLGKYQSVNLGIDKIKSLEVTPIPTATSTPTPIPTLSPTPTIYYRPIPTATPTPNPIIQTRINEIDAQIARLRQSIQIGIDAGKSINCAGGLACTATMNQIFANNNSYQQQILQLQAEKTQLQLK